MEKTSAVDFKLPSSIKPAMESVFVMFFFIVESFIYVNKKNLRKKVQRSMSMHVYYVVWRLVSDS